MSDLQEEVQAQEEVVQEEAVEEKEVKTKQSKSKNTGNLIADIAAEIEVLSKTKALNLAVSLAENIETNFFKLGGILKVIQDNGWFEGYADWETFVFEKFGFQKRKAYYLTQIYSDLVGKQIPWEKVSHLGWTKLKEISPIVNLDNLDTWIAKAEELSVVELHKLLTADKPSKEGSEKVSDEIVKLGPFKVKEDQAATIQHAMAKAKGEVGTEYDTVALENICSLYLSGNMGQISTSVDAKSVIKAIGWEETLNIFSELYPNVDITIDVK